MHIHIHFNHNRDLPHSHQGPFQRVAQEVGSTLGKFAGPASTERQRSDRARAEARNERYGGGVL